MSERCKGHPLMEREGGMMFIESLAELLRRLMDYRAVQQGDRNQHMHVMFNLLVRTPLDRSRSNIIFVNQNV